MSNPKNKQRYTAYAVTVGIFIVTIFLFMLLPSQPEAGEISGESSARVVNVSTFETGSFPTEIRITGRVASVDRVELFSEVQGVLISGDRPFRTGNRFQEGDVLVRLDNTEAALELASTRSRFQSALSAMLPEIRLDFPDRFETWAAYVEDINPKEPLPQFPEITDRTERFFFSANDIFGQYFSIRSAESRLEKFTIKAPFNGELRMADTFPGTLISPGVKLGEFFGDTHELESFVSVSDLDFIENGSRVTLKSPALEQELTGRISRIGRSVDPTTQAFPVFVEISSPKLRDGLYLEGRIRGRTLDDVSEIPRNLLTRENTVMVIEDGIATHRNVEPVYFNRETVLVRGLSSSDQVIELRAGTIRLAGSRVTAAE